jgi:hypothetical protein
LEALEEKALKRGPAGRVWKEERTRRDRKNRRKKGLKKKGDYSGTNEMLP